MNTTTQPNTVQTLLSESAVGHFECFLHWFYDDFNRDSFTDIIMTMLRVYIEACPKDVHQFRQPKWIAGFVSELIQLKEQLVDIMNEAKPWEWVDTIDGWAKLAPGHE